MTNKKLSELTALTAPARGDMIYSVNAGVSKRANIEAILAGPTILVAATGASVNSKKHADYVCDGTDDQVQLQAALTALPVSGGTIQLSEGTFTVADAGSGFCIQIARSNVHLIIPVGATIKLKDSEISGTEICNVIRIGDGSSVFSNIVIDGGGTIDGNEDNNVSTGSESSGADIFITGKNSNVFIRDLNILNASRDAIFIRGVDTSNRANNVHIENCVINNPAEGIVFESANNVYVVGNSITNTREQDGVEPVDNCSGWWIVNNYFAGIKDGNSAIDIFSNSTLNTNGFVIGNFILNNGDQYDIQIGNVATGPITNLLIKDNILNGGGMIVGAGGSASGTTSNVRIEGNILDGGAVATCTTGIRIEQYASAVSIVGNTIFNFRYFGVSVVSSPNAEIKNNRVYDNGRAVTGETNQVGINVNGNTNPTIIGNYCYDSRAGASRTQSYPISAQVTTGAYIFQNTFVNHLNGNFVLLDAATGYTVRQNAGMTTENQGAAPTVADGGTIGHGLYTTPILVTVSPSVSGEMVSVTSIDSTDFHVAVKKHDGSAGTTQTIYWEAKV